MEELKEKASCWIKVMLQRGEYSADGRYFEVGQYRFKLSMTKLPPGYVGFVDLKSGYEQNIQFFTDRKMDGQEIINAIMLAAAEVTPA